jgi:hypothetical protein
MRAIALQVVHVLVYQYQFSPIVYFPGVGHTADFLRWSGTSPAFLGEVDTLQAPIRLLVQQVALVIRRERGLPECY